MTRGTLCIDLPAGEVLADLCWPGRAPGRWLDQPTAPEDPLHEDLDLTAADREARVADVRASVVDALRDPATLTPAAAADVQAAAERRSPAARRRWVARAQRKIAARRRGARD